MKRLEESVRDGVYGPRGRATKAENGRRLAASKVAKS